METIAEGEIISTHDVVMMNGAKWPNKTIIYERNGQRYRGTITFDGGYYFGGAVDKFPKDVHLA